ncbi:MAG: hypothetical protein AAF849_06720 [Bacteroidota bacterium]
MDIRFVAQEEIDRLRWDSCIHYATNGNAFGYTWFLNNATKNWDALVEGEYESVLPLTWELDRLNRRVLRQPPLVRELGIYSVNMLSPRRMDAFLLQIPASYKSIQITLNERNTFKTDESYDWTPRKNYQLLMTDVYEVLRSKYDPVLGKNLKAQQDHLIPISNIKPELLAAFYKAHTKKSRKQEKTFHAIQRITYNAMHRGIGFSTGITDLEGNMLAMNFFIYSHGKVLSVLPLVSAQGKAQNALAMLFDRFIQSHAGRPLILDFNTNEAIAKRLGAKENIYYELGKEERKWQFLNKWLG